MEMNSDVQNVIPLQRSHFPLTAPPVIADKEQGPIEQKMRAVLSRLEGSNYPDQFDWSVYDKIAAKHKTPPRGGVVFNTVFKLINHHSSCSKCHYAFEIDTYGRGCYHNCVYCYAKDQLEKHGFWNRPQPFPVNLAEVRKVFYTVFETDKRSKWREILEKRIPIRLGSMSDCFMWLDKKLGVTRELLRILNYYNYPYIIVTRSDLIAEDQYIDLLRRDLCSVQFSITGNNNLFIRRTEPSAPNYPRRLAALKKLHDAGVWTTVRVNPLFPKYPDGYYTDEASIIQRFGSKANVPVLDLYDESFFDELAEVGVPSLLAGFIRLSGSTLNQMTKATGVDLRQFFKPEYLAVRGDKRYSDSEIRYYYDWFKKNCERVGMRFSTCYIGNGLKDYFQYQTHWSNKNDCCDVVGNVNTFTKTAQTVPWTIRQKHAPCRSAAASTEKEDLRLSTIFASTGKVPVKNLRPKGLEVLR